MTSPHAPIQVELDADIVHVRFPASKTDGNAVRALYELSAELSDQGQFKLLVDLTGVKMATSGMMGMLVTIKKRALSCGGQVHVLVPDPLIMGAFHTMNLHLLLLLFDDPQRARQFKP